ncbi:Mannose-6-phosphate isomerase [Fusarium albosuccineum]|uniref:Mannose-6-phosphate isomerase n=1 Tax=Fusarium albosuccineum TaxID=1237068 RepID=A0A8H4KWU9_9HYPO|nr:Mannose-6-phosphate isomerase [Fusarium albosuccineum]
MSTPAAPFYQLRCGCNQYPWGKQGSDSLAARLCAKTPGWDGDGNDKKDFKIDENTPYAEMWMGTYPVLPSYVANTGEDLQDVLDRYPKELLGEKVTTKFGHTMLPYLPKVLSIAKALPLQVHPNKEFSSKKHNEDPDSFTDPNHKPEIALSLTEFEAFCGFKPVEAIVDILRQKPLRHLLVAGGSTVADEKLSQEGLRQVVKTILKSSDEDVKKTFEAIRELPDSAFTGLNSAIPQVSKRLENQFPKTDPGILVGLLCMNYMLLQPGEVIYIPAGGIHAYISGDIIECMARSDNVLNTGFCPKTDRDNVDEFCSVLNWEPTTKTQTTLQDEAYSRSKEGKTKIFRPPTSEFNVLATELGASEREVLGEGGPSILLATRGNATIKANDQSFDLSEGHVYFIAQGVKLDITAGTDGLLMHTACVE